MGIIQIQPHEVDEHIKSGTLRIAFIGMSNAGKTYRSKILAREEDFFWYHVDGEIQTTLGFADESVMSTWLGYPNNPIYKEREAQYLALENKFTKVDHMNTQGKNLAFDTTGSVVHLTKDTLTWLSENCLIVYLTIDDSAIEMMLERYKKVPKPVIWGDHFNPVAGETDFETVTRCYPSLLHGRMKKYASISHVSIPAAEVFDTTGQETIEIIKKYL